MAQFDVRVRRLDDVLPHPNADRLALAKVDGYLSVVARDQFQAGDLVAYIPEAAIVPPALQEEMGLVGKLAGPGANRVKAILLRGMLSQGLVLPARAGWSEGQSVMQELGVTKFEPGVPEGAEGERYALEPEEYLAFDIENIKAFGHLIQDGEPVVMTEKVHGVFMAVGAISEGGSARPHYAGRAFVASKGVLSDRNAFVLDPPPNEDGAPARPNLYVADAKRLGLLDKAIALSDRYQGNAFILGEVFGVGVQDLGYATAPGAREFRAFAAAVRDESDNTRPGGWRWLDDTELETVLIELAIPRVPVVYRGPFSAQALAEATNGRELVSGSQAHIREGVVVVPATERISQELPAFRVALKSISASYLTRKGGTEYT